MIQSIDNKKEEISSQIDETHSASPISSSEKSKNFSKKTPHLIQKYSFESFPIKYNIKIRNNNLQNNETISNKSEEKNCNSTTSLSNSGNEYKKSFLEKKRKRKRSKSCYSNKKSKKKVNIRYQKINEKFKDVKTDENMDNSQMDSEAQNYKSTFDIFENGKKEKENNKKKVKLNEKELIAIAQKQFMEQINKVYSDEQYHNDLDLNLKDKRAQFMKENFPIMYRKDKYYLYTVLLKNRRTFPINFIQPNTLSESIKENKKLQTLYLNEELEESEQIIPNTLTPFENEEIGTKNNQIKNEKINLTKVKIKSKNQKSKQKNKKNILLEPENNDTNKKSISSKKTCKQSLELEKIKQNLIIPQPEKVQSKKVNNKNKKMNTGLSDTSPSEHDEIEIPNKLNFKTTYNLFPKHIWSVPDEERNLNVEKFYEDCIQVWPFDECTFVKEIALEFLMMNKYSTDLCLKRIKEFVLFMKKRAIELDISILNKNEKTVKKYSLRKTKIN